MKLVKKIMIGWAMVKKATMTNDTQVKFKVIYISSNTSYHIILSRAMIFVWSFYNNLGKIISHTHIMFLLFFYCFWPIRKEEKKGWQKNYHQMIVKYHYSIITKQNQPKKRKSMRTWLKWFVTLLSCSCWTH